MKQKYLPQYLITEAGGAHDDWDTHSPHLVTVLPLTPALADLVRSADAAARSAYAVASAAGAESVVLFFPAPAVAPTFVTTGASSLDNLVPQVHQLVWDNHLIVVRGPLDMPAAETAALSPDSLVLRVTYDGSRWPHFTWQAVVDYQCALGDWAGAEIMSMDLVTPDLLTGRFADEDRLSPPIVVDLLPDLPPHDEVLLVEQLPHAACLDLSSLWVRRPADPRTFRAGSGIHLNGIRIDACLQPDGSTRWAIRSGGRDILGQDGEWTFEPNPSSRTDEFYQNYRFDTLPEALAAALRFLADEFIVRLPDGFLMSYIDGQATCTSDPLDAATFSGAKSRAFWSARFPDAELRPARAESE